MEIAAGQLLTFSVSLRKDRAGSARLFSAPRRAAHFSLLASQCPSSLFPGAGLSYDLLCREKMPDEAVDVLFDDEDFQRVVEVPS
ncbi:hypothetical protein [Bradyrhizobium niftali]|uniref:Uncharacterized protein n=1 Tax=Bradyrhizobium niftali TaxID=2560055 RepID=A0A4Y9KZB0_9BRAD|nr:hypothetical protein [Bradyrhizobium niftali]TFV35857.1 hypothetical protein E4K65_46235 [Bradyrhizobium niftali]